MSWWKRTFKTLFSTEHAWVAILTLIIILLSWEILINVRMFNPVCTALRSFSYSDFYYDIKWPTDGTKPEEVSTDITIVDIGNLDRQGIADLLSEINRYTPAAIGVDVIFYGNKDIESDYYLDSVASSLPNTIFACRLTDYDAHNNNYENAEYSFFATDSTRIGYVNTETKRFEPMRKFSMDRQLNGDTISSLVAQVAEIYMRSPIVRNSNQFQRIDYEYIGFNKLNKDNIAENKHLIDNRIVLVGALDDPKDRFETPIHEMSGVEILGYSIQTLIDHRIIRDITDGWYYLVLFLFSYITAVWDFYWNRLLARNKSNPVVLFLVTSRLAYRGLMFLLMAILAWITFITFEMADIFIPLVPLFVMPILVGDARTIYQAITKNKKNSIYKF